LPAKGAGKLLIFEGLAAAAALAAPSGDQPAPAPPQETAEIVVTGERVPRSLRETSSSLALFGQKEIEASGADRLDQILALVPNVQFGNGNQGPTIRGQDTTGALTSLPAFLGGNRPRTTVIIDGRPALYNELVFGAFPVWDVERIEVFRTPQTTTQGVNSIAGAIFVNSNQPSFEPQYRARAIVGDFMLRQVSAVASGPLAGDDVAFRVAGDFRYRRTSSDIVDVIADADPNHDVFGLLRAKLLVNAGPATRITLTYAHSHSQAPQVVGVTPPFRKRRDEGGAYGIFRINVDSLTAGIRHQSSPDLTASLLFTVADNAVTRFAIPGLGQSRVTGRDWNGEAVLNWTPEGLFKVVGGVAGNRVALKQFLGLELLSGSIGRFRDRKDSLGIFGDVSFQFLPDATVTAGIRYQRDRQKRQGALTATTFVVPVDFTGKFDAWLPKLTFAYDVTPELRLGALVQKAYNPGGTTVRVDTSQVNNFKAETLWDYEVFARAELLDGRASARANLFYYDMRNAQRSDPILIFTPSGRVVGFANLFNVPKARTYGAEGQLDWRVSGTLSVKGAVGFLGTKFVKTDSESADFHGNEFDRAPHFTGSAAVEWRPTDRLRLSAQLRHHSPFYGDPDNLPEFRVPSGTSTDFRAEYRLGRLSFFSQVRNVFDAFNMLDVNVPGEAEDPRTFSFGIEASY
jgi:iron complex outermembrane receptor protein